LLITPSVPTKRCPKESQTAQNENPKTQQSRGQPTAFLQNRILASEQIARKVSRFGIVHGRLRIVDESADDYLYPKASFRPIALPQAVKKAVLAA
jgi:hypothetical protein